jgi:DNA repair protein RadC
MKQLAATDRPREKLERAGPGALGDNELVAILVGHGTADADALGIANRILSASGGAHGLTRMTRDELSRVSGVGSALAGRIQAAIELGRRTLLVSPPARHQFLSPDAAAVYLLPRFGAHPVERFGVMLLDSRHRLIRTRLISVGSLDASLGHPREVFREALDARAAALIAFHNHPSGDATATADDVELTERLMAAGAVIGVDVLDHLVLADTHYCSIGAIVRARNR